MVFADSWMRIGVPVASGATFEHGGGKVLHRLHCRFDCRSASPRPAPCRPSLIQSCLQVLRQRGERHVLGVKARPDLLEPQLQAAEQRVLDCRRALRHRRRRALSATSPMAAFRHLRSCRRSAKASAASLSACRVSSSLGGAFDLGRHRASDRASDAASAMMASFSSWSFGTKLCSVSVLETSGSRSRRSRERRRRLDGRREDVDHIR